MPSRAEQLALAAKNLCYIHKRRGDLREWMRLERSRIERGERTDMEKLADGERVE